MTKKQILRCVLFLLLLSVVLFVLCDLFEQENSLNHDKRFHQYRSFPENTVDAVYIGTSGVDRYWIASKAYDEYGMTVYPLSSDALPAWLYIHMIEEAYAHQNPQLLLLDVRAFCQDNAVSDADIKTDMDIRARRVIDAMDFTSPNRLKVAMTTMETIHKVDPTQPRWDVSYLLSFVRYHSKWSGEDFLFTTSLGQRDHRYLGFYYDDWLTVYHKSLPNFRLSSTHTYPLEPLTEEILYEVLDYIREKDLNVLFVDTPQMLDPKDAGRTNRIYEILEEEGFDYVHFYNMDDAYPFSIVFDYKKDFYNASHVNYYGAEKFTAAFAAYLDEHYDLPDRRNDPAVSEIWDGNYDYLLECIAEIEAEMALYKASLLTQE